MNDTSAEAVQIELLRSYDSFLKPRHGHMMRAEAAAILASSALLWDKLDRIERSVDQLTESVLLLRR